MRKIVLALAFVGSFIVFAAPTQAQVEVGAIGAFHDDFDLGIGALVGVPLPSLSENMRAQADLIFFFPGEPDNLDYFEVNGNLLYDIPMEDQPFTPFILGGLNLANVSVDGPGDLDGSETELGLNLGGGLSFETASNLRPQVGLRVELSGGEGFVLFGSLAIGG